MGDLILINIYLPVWKDVHLHTAEVLDLFAQISNCLNDLSYTKLIVGGDFNFQLPGIHPGVNLLGQFIKEHNLIECDRFIQRTNVFTYFHETLNAKSLIDHFLVSGNIAESRIRCDVLESGINLSDHNPITLSLFVDLEVIRDRSRRDARFKGRLRWDKVDLNNYYVETFCRLLELYEQFGLHNAYFVRDCNFIEALYRRLVEVLISAAALTVPRASGNFYKHWWNDELSELKMKSVDAHKLWVAAGKPHGDSLYHLQRVAKLTYKKALRDKRLNDGKLVGVKLEKNLMDKDNISFWKTWNSKFNTNKKLSKCINGETDSEAIANVFAEHFSKCATSKMNDNGESFQQFLTLHDNYMETNVDYVPEVNINMVDSCLRNMKLHKAAGVDELEVEHLLYAHPLVLTMLVTLFNSMLLLGYVPNDFGKGIIVPVIQDGLGKEDDVNNYRAVTISSSVSKLFEMCLLRLLSDFLTTSDLQFGFKKGLGCRDAIFSLQFVVEYFVKHGSTVNVCLLDMSKAFDKLNHYVLFVKLMKRGVPGLILKLLISWYGKCTATVQWGDTLSTWFNLTCGVRQGGVLSPNLFTVYVDNLLAELRKSNFGCWIGDQYIGCIMYADDLVLLSASVNNLQIMLDMCGREALVLGMEFNAKKSNIIRFGPRYKASICDVTLNNCSIQVVKSAKYLGISLLGARRFKLSFDDSRRKFFRAANGILSKCKGKLSDMSVLHLINMKCKPFLLYALEAVLLLKSELASVQSDMNMVYYKNFNVHEMESVALINEIADIRSCGTEYELQRTRYLTNLKRSGNCVVRALASFMVN